MKVLKIIKNVLIGIILIVFFAFAICMTILMLNINKYGVTEFSSSVMLIIKDKVSLDHIKKNSIVMVDKKEISDIKVGDEIFIYKVKADGGVNIDVGIVGEIHDTEQAVTFENGSTYGAKFLIGTPGKVYEDYGKYLGIVMSKWGFLFIVLIPSFLIFVYELYALVIEIKYGREDSQA